MLGTDHCSPLKAGLDPMTNHTDGYIPMHRACAREDFPLAAGRPPAALLPTVVDHWWKVSLLKNVPYTRTWEGGLPTDPAAAAQVLGQETAAHRDREGQRSTRLHALQLRSCPISAWIHRRGLRTISRAICFASAPRKRPR